MLRRIRVPLPKPRCSRRPLSTHVYDPHRTLGVRPGCTEAELKAAYRRLALEHHPDRQTGGGGDAARLFAQISEAYETLQAQRKGLPRAGTAARTQWGEQSHGSARRRQQQQQQQHQQQQQQQQQSADVHPSNPAPGAAFAGLALGLMFLISRMSASEPTPPARPKVRILDKHDVAPIGWSRRTRADKAVGTAPGTGDQVNQVEVEEQKPQKPPTIPPAAAAATAAVAVATAHAPTSRPTAEAAVSHSRDSGVQLWRAAAERRSAGGTGNAPAAVVGAGEPVATAAAPTTPPLLKQPLPCEAAAGAAAAAGAGAGAVAAAAAAPAGSTPAAVPTSAEVDASSVKTKKQTKVQRKRAYGSSYLPHTGPGRGAKSPCERTHCMCTPRTR